jgi:hypothetical protein
MGERAVRNMPAWRPDTQTVHLARTFVGDSGQRYLEKP